MPPHLPGVGGPGDSDGPNGGRGRANGGVRGPREDCENVPSGPASDLSAPLRCGLSFMCAQPILVDLAPARRRGVMCYNVGVSQRVQFVAVTAAAVHLRHLVPHPACSSCWLTWRATPRGAVTGKGTVLRSEDGGLRTPPTAPGRRLPWLKTTKRVGCSSRSPVSHMCAGVCTLRQRAVGCLERGCGGASADSCVPRVSS